MALPRRAKLLADAQIDRAVAYLSTTGRYQLRNTAMFLLSVRAGLRAKEISCLTWSMVTDPEGELAPSINLENIASKGKTGGRVIPIRGDLADALKSLRASHRGVPPAKAHVIRSERSQRLAGGQMSAQAISEWFTDLYESLGLQGCTSHSGRRTFITRIARTIQTKGGSLADVQYLAGHSSLATTQIYIEGDSEAQRQAIEAM
jgi:integrase/recombinase XerD